MSLCSFARCAVVGDFLLDISAEPFWVMTDPKSVDKENLNAMGKDKVDSCLLTNPHNYRGPTLET